MAKQAFRVKVVKVKRIASNCRRYEISYKDACAGAQEMTEKVGGQSWQFAPEGMFPSPHARRESIPLREYPCMESQYLLDAMCQDFRLENRRTHFIPCISCTPEYQEKMTKACKCRRPTLKMKVRKGSEVRIVDVGAPVLLPSDNMA